MPRWPASQRAQFLPRPRISLPPIHLRRAEALHAYGERSHFENDARIGSIAMWPIVPGARRDYGFRSPLQDSMGIITPAPLHFIISHGHEPPDIDPREHRLMIHGMVDRPVIFRPG